MIRMVKIVDPHKANKTKMIPASDLRPWHQMVEDVKVVAPQPEQPMAQPKRATDGILGEIGISDDWRKAPWPELRSICAEISDTPVNSRAQAISTIESEIERRRSEKTD
jgi:hypothetical protein